MNRTIRAIALMFVLAAGSALAQGGPPGGGGMMMPKGRWWRMPQVAQQLSLSADQQSKLDAIFNATSTELIDLKADVDKLGIELRAQLEKPQSAKKDVLAVAQKLGVARGRLFEREIGMMVDMKGVLTEEQWAMLRDKLEERADRMRDDARGGKPERPRPRNQR